MKCITQQPDASILHPVTWNAQALKSRINENRQYLPLSVITYQKCVVVRSRIMTNCNLRDNKQLSPGILSTSIPRGHQWSGMGQQARMADGLRGGGI